MEALKLNRLTSLHVMREMEIPRTDTECRTYVDEDIWTKVKSSDLKIKCNALINTLHDNQTIVFNGSAEYLATKSEEYLQSLLFDEDEWNRPLFNYASNPEQMRSADTAKESIQSALRILKVTESRTVIIIIRHKHDHQNIGFF